MLYTSNATLARKRAFREDLTYDSRAAIEGRRRWIGRRAAVARRVMCGAVKPSGWRRRRARRRSSLSHALADFAAAEKTSERAAAAQAGAQHDAHGPCYASEKVRVAGALTKLCCYSLKQNA